MPPYLLTQVTDDMRVMKEEIFGPILPVISYRTFDEVLDIINSRPRPLALYLMSNDKQKQQYIVRNTHGGVVFNDTLVHFAVGDAPFGGIGESGMGHYHSKGLLTFSKAKTVMSTPTYGFQEAHGCYDFADSVIRAWKVIYTINNVIALFMSMVWVIGLLNVGENQHWFNLRQCLGTDIFVTRTIFD